MKTILYTTPKDINAWMEEHCPDPPSMFSLRKAFIRLLRYFFSNPQHYSYPELGCYQYSDDSSKSTLDVNLSGTFDQTDEENLPCITLSLGEGINYNIDVFNNVAVSTRDMAQLNTKSFGTVYITVTCAANNADISCLLSDLCAMFLSSITPVLIRTWGWVKKYRLIKQSEPKINNSSSESVTKRYESLVVLQLDFEYNVTIDIESKRLKDVSIY